MYKVNEIDESKFLEDSEIKYYLMGYILGDGCLTGKCVQIDSKDSEELSFIGNTVGARLQDKGKSSRLQIFSESVYSYYKSIGFVERKSFVGIPKKIEVPKEYQGHFLRGWIDSDGSIGRGGRKENPAPDVRLLISNLGKELETLQDILDSNNLKCSFSTKGSLITVRFSRKSLHTIKSLLYPGNEVYFLRRKREEFLKWYDEWNKYKHYSKVE